MASTMYLSLLVALCSLATLHAGPVQVPKAPLISRLQQWPDITKMLQNLERMLAAVEKKVKDTASQVEATVEAVLQDIEQAAQNAANNWNATVLEWVDEVEEDTAAIEVCLQEENRAMAVVLDELRADALACVNERMEDINETLKNLTALAPEAEALLDETKAEIERCLQEPSSAKQVVCMLAALPAEGTKEAVILTEALHLSAEVIAEAGGIVPLGAICAAEATAKRGAEATVVIKETIACIEASLGPSTSTVQDASTTPAPQ